MIKQLYKIFMLIGIICTGVSLNAQDYDIEINLMIPPPYPVNLDAYVDYLEQGIVQVSNISEESKEVFFSVSLKENSNRISVNTNGALAQSITIEPGMTILTPSDISDIFSGLTENDINTSGLSQFQRDNVLLSKQLPEGSYQLCVFAFNAQMEAISDPDGNGCFDFDVTYPERPSIDQPFNNEIVDTSEIINILWSQFLTDPSAMSRTEYTLTIIDLTEQNIDNFQDAFLDPGISPDYEEELGNTRIKVLQNNVDIPLIKGHKYAARITAVDPQGILAYQFGGHSEILPFFYGSAVGEDDNKEIVAPSIITPNDDGFLNSSEDIQIKWEHEVEENNNFNYTLKVIDKTAEGITSISNTDIDSSKYAYIVNIPIIAKDTLLKVNSAAWLKDHKYSIIIKASPEDENIELANGGYSKVISFKLGEPKKQDLSENCGKEAFAPIPSDQKSVAIGKDKEYILGKIILKTDKDNDPDGTTENGFSGTGYISVKLVDSDIKVKVKFTNLKANKKKEVFEGTAVAVDNNGAELDAQIASLITGESGAGYDEIAGVTTYARLRAKIEAAQNGGIVGLPLGIDRKVKGENLVVGITAMNFSPQKATLTALFSIENPEWKNQLPVLGATDVCFTSTGISNEFVKLYLGKDFVIPIDGGETLTLKASKNDGQDENAGTYAKMGKSGFLEGQITGEIGIPRKILLPEDKDGQILPGDEKAKLTLSGTFRSKKNYMLSASMSACQIPGLEGFSFQLENGFYDNSDVKNPEGIAFPENFPVQPSNVTWKGVWFSNATISAPQGWGLAGESTRTTLSIKNFIKDKTGVFLKGEATQVLDINKGSIEGFAISIDKLALSIHMGKFQRIKMEGQLGLPILPDGQYLEYVGLIDKPQAPATEAKDNNQKKGTPLSMSLSAKARKEGYDIPWLKAHIDFDTTSHFSLINNAKEKGVRGEFAGKISIKNEDEGSATLNIPGIKFQGMGLSKITSKGAKTPGKFKFTAPTFDQVGEAKSDLPDPSGNTNTVVAKEKNTSKKKMNGFSLQLDSVNMEVEEGADGNITHLNLSVSPKIMLVGGKSKKAGDKKKEGFSVTAAGTFKIITDVSGTEPRDMKFSYNTVELNSFEIESSVKAIGIKGFVSFKNKGKDKYMAGELEIKTPLTKVDVKAKFGRNEEENYNYWYLFGEAGKAPPEEGFPKALKKLGPYVTLYGFHGGAYYHMEDKYPEKDADERYVPNNEILLGLEAGVTLAVKKPEILWAKTTLSAVFNSDGGLKSIGLNGDAYMLKKNMVENPILNNDGTNVSGVQALLKATINFKNNSIEDFDADMDVYANVEGKFKGGSNDMNLVTNSTMSIKDGKWHLWIGKPSKKASLKFNLAGIAELNAMGYLMMGNKKMDAYTLPTNINTWLDIPPPPDFEAGRKIDKNESTRKFNGNEFEFGLGAELNYTLNLDLAILYTRFEATLGFDLALTKSRGGVVCANNLDGKGKPIEKGMNGWYADGQVYAGLEGDLGIKVDIFFYSGNISLVNLQAAMLIKGGLPNPIYLDGTATMKYKVLGGLIRGSTSFDVKFGEQCDEVITDDLSGIKFVESMGPEEGTDEVSVFATPSVSFASKVDDGFYEDEVYEIRIPKQSLPSKFKVTVEKFKLYKTEDKSRNAVAGKVRWEGHTEKLFNASEMLAPHTEYTLVVKLKAKKYDYNTRQWNYYQKKDKTDWSESDSTTFTTGALPDYIPMENVELSYPFLDEAAYLQDENYWHEGFIALKNNQAYLFPEINSRASKNSQWIERIVARFQEFSKYGVPKVFGVTNVRIEKAKFVKFDIPRNLPNKTKIDIIIVKEYYRNPNYKEVATTTEKSISKFTSITKNGKTYKNASSYQPPESKTYFKYRFKTSGYNTFKDKIKSGLTSSIQKGSLQHIKAVNVIYYQEKVLIDKKVHSITKTRLQKSALYSSGLRYDVHNIEPFSYAEAVNRKIRQSRSNRGPMMLVNENYDTPFYSSVFDFFYFENRFLAVVKTLLPGLNTTTNTWGDSGDRWQNNYKLKKNSKIFYSLKRDGSRDFKSVIIKHAELDAARVLEYSKSFSAISPYFTLKLNQYFKDSGILNISMSSGTYSLTMKYLFPHIDNGEIKEYYNGDPIKVEYYHNATKNR